MSQGYEFSLQWKGNKAWKWLWIVLCGGIEDDHMCSAVKTDKKLPPQVDKIPLFKHFWQACCEEQGTSAAWFSMFVFTSTWQVVGPVQWHIQKWFYNYLANYIWLLNCPLFQRKYISIYIYREKIKHTIKFFLSSSSFGYTEVKTSAVSKFFRESKWDRPSPKAPSSSKNSKPSA